RSWSIMSTNRPRSTIASQNSTRSWPMSERWSSCRNKHTHANRPNLRTLALSRRDSSINSGSVQASHSASVMGLSPFPSRRRHLRSSLLTPHHSRLIGWREPLAVHMLPVRAKDVLPPLVVLVHGSLDAVGEQPTSGRSVHYLPLGSIRGPRRRFFVRRP